jgi:hypothetical protein
VAFRALLCLASVAVAAGGCAVVDPVDSRYDTIGRSLAKARNEAIFLNLVRASHDYPLSFVTISNVTPTMTNVTGLGLPSFLLGPAAVFGTANGSIQQSLPTSGPGRDAVFGSSTASNSTSVSSNFNVATQETYAFYEGFLKPIDLTTLNYFIRQGYPRELLFWLFTDSFELEQNGRKLGYQYNPPGDYGCSQYDPQHRCFIDWVQLATSSGLTVEELTQQKPGGAAPKSGGETSGAAAKPTITTFSRFCFNSVLAQRALTATGQEVKQSDLTFFATLSPKCGKGWNPLATANQPQPDILPLQVAGATFRIVPRSAYGVFEFLGGLMKAQRERLNALPSAYIPPGRKSGPNNVVDLPVLLTAQGDKSLMTVVPDSKDLCFVHTWFYDGDYCVPETATNTKRVFSLLAQLIAIQTAATDLSITPVVRVIQ